MYTHKRKVLMFLMIIATTIFFVIKLSKTYNLDNAGVGIWSVIGVLIIVFLYYIGYLLDLDLRKIIKEVKGK